MSRRTNARQRAGHERGCGQQGETMSGAQRVLEAIKAEGLKSAVWRSAKVMSTRYNPFSRKPLATVYPDEVSAVDWTTARDFNSGAIEGRDSGYRVAWIITPPGRTSGGHQNAFRFMDFLEKAGHQLTVYLYSPSRYPVVSIEAILEMMRETSAYPDLKATFRLYDPERGFDAGYDALFASDWENAYSVYRYEGNAKRFYFVQDFEPAFFAAGSDYIVAENTYRLGFHGFSAGRWLARKLRSDYGMSCDYYDYAVDTTRYRHLNSQPRNEILFYVRPPTPRRATEFGLLALREFHLLRPDVTINLVGWDMSGFDVPFPYVNHSAVDISALNDIYNRCAAGLALSLTNMSLVPMEIMSSGVVPVVNDAPNTHGFFDSPHIEYVPMSPRAIAERIVQILDRPDASAHAAVIARSVEETKWSDPGSTFTEDFATVMRTSPHRVADAS
ncbi:glycosyltransferase family 1 protein [Cryobacterium sp. HLT2-28]|uniref:rhamnosyltransferase WsaF family glycosyltransferase n=1 Tax=Cryobacterium sp. HLT2-28 TaxID=1259146 RepID=UPI00106CDBD0|nr:glycosyltransferase family 1 protein [Cryobacterium sp. HLT2-28]TFB91020.1 glycosyltransferase family 1 protein [Cryobacterium sp. HLT2-28]